MLCLQAADLYFLAQIRRIWKQEEMKALSLKSSKQIGHLSSTTPTALGVLEPSLDDSRLDFFLSVDIPAV